MKFYNANIKSREEALKRMIDGEIFYLDESMFYYSWSRSIFVNYGCLEEKRLSILDLNKFSQWSNA